MINCFSPYDYTPYLDNEGNPLATTSIAGLADDSLNSSLRPYDAPTPQPTRSSSGYRYRDSSHTSPRAEHTEVESSKARESTELQKESEFAGAQADPTVLDKPAPTSTQPPPTAPVTSSAPTATFAPPTTPISSTMPPTAPSSPAADA